MTATLIAPRTRKPRGQGASRRAEIMEAAKRIFLEEGVAHATMRRIAASVGVSATALYVYFPDKDAILKAIAEAMFAELLAVHNVSQQVGNTPLERFSSVLHAYVELGLARPGEYRLTFSTAKRLKPCETIADADASFALLERGVAELMATGVFRPANTRLVTEAVWTGLHGLVCVLLDHADHLLSNHQTLIDTALQAIIRGHGIASDHC